jgi:hypothetical protein
MKNRFFSFILAVVVFLSFGGMQKAEVEKIEAKIKEAEKCFFSTTEQADNCKEGFKLLLDAIEMTAPYTEFSAEFKNKISTANKIFKETSIFNPKGVALITEAYRTINSGKDFEMPSSILKIEDAVAYARKQVKTARKDLKEGNYNNSAKLSVTASGMLVFRLSWADLL